MDAGDTTQHARKGFGHKRFVWLDFIDNRLASVERALNIIGVGLIMFLMFFAAAEIVGRYCFNQPIPGHVEIVELLMAGVVFLGFAYTQQVGGHIRMQILVTKLLHGKSYLIAEALVITLSLLAFIVITIGSFKFALLAYRIGDVTSYIKWPTWPSKLCIPIGSFALSLRLFLQLLQRIVQLVAGTTPDSSA